MIFSQEDNGSHRWCSKKTVFLEISQTSQENNSVGVFFRIKLQAFTQQVFYKETPTQALSCEVCETFKNIYYEEHQQMAASGGVLSESCS